jgi:hypothetical protein
MASNKFDNKLAILSDLWMQYRYDAQFEDFVSYNDLGLPMAFMVHEELVKPSPLGRSMIEETYDLLLASLKVEDGEHESLDDLLMG